MLFFPFLSKVESVFTEESCHTEEAFVFSKLISPVYFAWGANVHPDLTWGKEVATSEWTRLSRAGEKQTRVKRQSLTVLVNEVRVWQNLEFVMEGFEG